MIAKSAVIKDRGGKSGGRAAKAVGLTSGGLRCVSVTRLRLSQGDLTATQKSAEGIVGGSASSMGVGSPCSTRPERVRRVQRFHDARSQLASNRPTVTP